MNEDIRDFLDYCSDSGIFTWKKSFGRVKAGATAGCVCSFKGGMKYERVSFRGKKYRSHRLAWFFYYGYTPDSDIDHIDRNPLNNAISNLRLVTQKENNQNRILKSDICTGVVSRQYFLAQIVIDGRYIKLGKYDNVFDAICARKSAENKLAQPHLCMSES